MYIAQISLQKGFKENIQKYKAVTGNNGAFTSTSLKQDMTGDKRPIQNAFSFQNKHCELEPP